MFLNGRGSILCAVLLAALGAPSWAQEQALTCYQCAGYWESSPVDAVKNNPDCDVNRFSSSSLKTVTNTSSEPTNLLICFTVALTDPHHNGGRPFTVRDMTNVTVIPSMELAFPDIELAMERVRELDPSNDLKENWKIFMKGEMCQYDRCNDLSGAVTMVVLPTIVLLLLPLCASMSLV